MSGDTGERFATPRTLSKKGFALRPEQEEDIPFLSLLFYTTRSEETERFSNMSYEQRVAFLVVAFTHQQSPEHGVDTPDLVIVPRFIGACDLDGFAQVGLGFVRVFLAQGVEPEIEPRLGSVGIGFSRNMKMSVRAYQVRTDR